VGGGFVSCAASCLGFIPAMDVAASDAHRVSVFRHFCPTPMAREYVFASKSEFFQIKNEYCGDPSISREQAARPGTFCCGFCA
jgi:hypothetical protein